jgi:hypothetical protein
VESQLLVKKHKDGSLQERLKKELFSASTKEAKP